MTSHYQARPETCRQSTSRDHLRSSSGLAPAIAATVSPATATSSDCGTRGCRWSGSPVLCGRCAIFGRRIDDVRDHVAGLDEIADPSAESQHAGNRCDQAVHAGQRSGGASERRNRTGWPAMRPRRWRNRNRLSASDAANHPPHRICRELSLRNDRPWESRSGLRNGRVASTTAWSRLRRMDRRRCRWPA